MTTAVMKLSAIMVLLAVLATACTSSGPAVIPADFSAEVFAPRDDRTKVEGTDLEIEVTSTGVIILDEGEIYEASVTLSGIGDDLDVWMEDVGPTSSVEYGGYLVVLRSVQARGDDRGADFSIAAAP